MRTRFITHSGQELEGSLVYAADEYSFRFDAGSPADITERIGASGVTSLSVGTLQIEVDIDSRLVLFVWGLHPRTRWINGRVAPPHYRRATVEVVEPRDLSRGVSIGLAEVNDWSTVYDPETGWIRVARPAAQDDELVMVSTGTVLGFEDAGELASVWLQPVLD